MQSVKVSVKQVDLAEILNTMREWLDRERCNLWHFRHAGDGTGLVVIDAGFATGDACDRKSVV